MLITKELVDIFVYRNVDGARTACRDEVSVCPSLQQPLHARERTRACGIVERRIAVNVDSIKCHVRTVQKHRYAYLVVALSSTMQRSAPMIIHGISGSLGVEQCLHVLRGA
eukprot:scaffold159866_cov36-Tisochrysis_lutea.AAC.2